MSRSYYVVSRAIILVITIHFFAEIAHCNLSVERDHNDAIAVNDAEDAPLSAEVGQSYSDSKYYSQRPLRDDHETNVMLESFALAIPQVVNCNGSWVRCSDVFAAHPSIVNGIPRQWTQQQLQNALDNAQECGAHKDTADCCGNPPCKCKSVDGKRQDY